MATRILTINIPPVTTINQRLDQIKAIFTTYLADYFEVTQDTGVDSARILEMRYIFEPSRRFRWMASSGSYSSTLIYVRKYDNSGDTTNVSIGSWSGTSGNIFAHLVVNDTTGAGQLHFSLTSSPSIAQAEIRFIWAKTEVNKGRLAIGLSIYGLTSDLSQSIQTCCLALGSASLMFDSGKQPFADIYVPVDAPLRLGDNPLIGLKGFYPNIKGVSYYTDFSALGKTYKQIALNSSTYLIAIEL